MLMRNGEMDSGLWLEGGLHSGKQPAASMITRNRVLQRKCSAAEITIIADPFHTLRVHTYLKNEVFEQAPDFIVGECGVLRTRV